MENQPNNGLKSDKDVLQKNQKSAENVTFDVIDSILSTGNRAFSAITRFFKKITGRYDKSLIYLEDIAIKIMKLRSKMVAMTDEELAAQTKIFKRRLKKESLDEILVEAFAVVREVARRILNEEPYKVQLMGGIALHKGMIAEMRTGEGKTLVASMPAYLNALTEKGVLIVTVNDYLARRDSRITGQIFEFLGLSVGCITSDLGCNSLPIKKEAYQKDITYATNSEIGFDYLRDHVAQSQSDLCQREYNGSSNTGDKNYYYCIVDEADSILIDEARTPLIMSSSPDYKTQQSFKDGYIFANDIVKSLDSCDYLISFKEQEVTLTDSGVKKVENLIRKSGMIGEDDTVFLPRHTRILHQIGQALKAHHMYFKGKHYVVHEKNRELGEPERSVKIVDENTGRVLEGRRYSEGLHQALEAKEEAPIKPETGVVASVTYRCLFKLCEKLAGMTGTAVTEEEEFEKIYNLHCISVPTNKPIKRKDHCDICCGSEEQKVQAIISRVRECHEKGQPVLLGTIDVNSCDYYYRRLLKEGFSKIYVSALSAEYHEKEAEIIANAGRFKHITVVTNMAGRGTDIKLGGSPGAIEQTLNVSDPADREWLLDEIEENKKAVLEAGGLCVIGTQHNINRRVDNQLRGRSGRQGDPGETYFYVGPQDVLFQEYKLEGAQFLETHLADGPEMFDIPLVTKTQESIEAMFFESRHALQKYADIKEFYMLQFYHKRQKILKRPIAEDLVSDFQHLLSEENAIQWFLVKDEEYTTDILLKKFNSRLEELKEQKKDRFNEYLRARVLENLDDAWTRYLKAMSHIRDTVQFQQYAQRDTIMYYAEIAENRFKEIMYNAFYEMFYGFIESEEEVSESAEFNLDQYLDAYLTGPSRNVDMEIDKDTAPKEEAPRETPPLQLSGFAKLIQEKMSQFESVEKLDSMVPKMDPRDQLGSLKDLIQSLSEKIKDVSKMNQNQNESKSPLDQTYSPNPEDISTTDVKHNNPQPVKESPSVKPKARASIKPKLSVRSSPTIKGSATKEKATSKSVKQPTAAKSSVAKKSTPKQDKGKKV